MAPKANILIELSAQAELFHAPDGTGFATIPVDSHRETWPVQSKGFRRWLAREFFNETKSAPNSEILQSVLNIIEARAHFDSVARPVYVRLGEHEDRIYLDLADDEWRAIEIDALGWRVVAQAPIAFRRPRGMLALPEPVRGGKIEDLRPFLNVSDDDEFVLTVSYELAAMRPRGPYPVLDLIGEHGAAKSTFASVLRKLIDPNTAQLRALPREDRDLFIAANNAHLQAYDNISRLPDWLSDSLCRLSTGGGYATRELYSDQDEALFDAVRPIILNGIEDFVGRSDLADRAIILALKNITDDNRRPESEFWAEFERAQPRILGALLDGVVHGLRQLPKTRLAASPRMADFALWATACEGAFRPSGTFLKAYAQNIDAAIATMIEADRVARAVQSLMAARIQWTGTSADLLDELNAIVGEDQRKLKEWPKSPRGLSGRLRRAAATLRRVGIEITFNRDDGSKRIRRITIARTTPAQAAADSTDAPTASTADSAAPGAKTAQDIGDESEPAPPPPEPEAEPAGDDVDGWSFNREPDDAAPPVAARERAAAAPAPSFSFHVIGPAPGEACAHCGQAAGNVLLIRDPRGVASSPLHEACAPAFYKRAVPLQDEAPAPEPKPEPEPPLPSDPIERWRKCFARLDPRCDPCAGFRSGEWPRMHGIIRAFLDSGLAKRAADSKWSDLELFGVHPEVGVARPDCCGVLMANTRGAPVTNVTQMFFQFGNLVGRKASINVNGSIAIWNWKKGDVR